MAAAGGGALALVGYLAVDGLAAGVGVAGTDLDYDSGAFLVLAGALVLIGVALTGIAGVSAWALDRYCLPVEPGKAMLVRTGVVAGVLFLVLQGVATLLSGWWAILPLALAFVSLGGIVAVVARFPGDDQAGRRWAAAAFCVLIPVFMAFQAARGLADDGRELAAYANALVAGDADATDVPTSLLSFMARPQSGVVRMVDGVEFCAVRVSSRVFLAPTDGERSAAQAIILEPATFRASDCAPEPFPASP